MVSAAVVGALTACTSEPLHNLCPSSTLSWNRSNVTTSSSSPASIVRASRFRNGIRRGACGVQVRAGVASSPRTSTLQYKKLGDSDLLISEITLGTMTWGNQNTEKEAHEQLCYAFDNGINIFDSAESYPTPMNAELQGRTDRYISTWLKTMPRDKVIVATKVAGYSERSTYLRDSGQTVRVNEENITESVEKSLKRLGTDHIDLLQIHWPDRYVPLFGENLFNPENIREAVPIVEQLQALKKVIDQGKVRYVGVSNESSWGVMEFTRLSEQLNLPKIVSIQNNYSLLTRTQFEVDLVEVCLPQNCNVGLLTYSPLAGGSLSGKYLDPEKSVKARFNLFPGYMARYNKSLARQYTMQEMGDGPSKFKPLLPCHNTGVWHQIARKKNTDANGVKFMVVMEAVSAYVEVGKKHGLSPVELALAFVRDRFFVTSNIIGATSLEQLKENMNAYAVTRPLPEEVTADIEAVFKRFRDPAFT